MRPLRLLKPCHNSRTIWRYSDHASYITAQTFVRTCASNAPLTHSVSDSPHLAKDSGSPEQKVKRRIKKALVDIPADHRAIGTTQSLFTSHVSSPGAPFFLPDGTHIFQKLVSFLRAQFPLFGFREVLTPTMYKDSLWERSGHWANYKEDMFTVTGNLRNSREIPAESQNGRMQQKVNFTQESGPEQYGLKPMNCPGHCILFQSQRRSYKDLPIRYAEFSPLHRNEISGALSGLTRVRRFHQDDGHIFCRPNQVQHEISKTLEFVKLVYSTLGLQDYRFVLSTRPSTDYIGSTEEWNRAEDHLQAALQRSQVPWETRIGDGAFYGPKIDIIINDSDGKQHQTATIQLDFQLPKRFDLVYDAPAPDSEAKGESSNDPNEMNRVGKVTPVMIHRAIFGSLERFMALLLEHRNGKLPFWLSSRQVIILPITNDASVLTYAHNLRSSLTGNLDRSDKPLAIDQPNYIVDTDESGDAIAQKVARAKSKKYNVICVVGEKNITGSAAETVDVDVSAQPDQQKTWEIIEAVKTGRQASVRNEKESAGESVRGKAGRVRLSMGQVKDLLARFSRNYA